MTPRELNRKRAKRPKVKTGCQTCKVRMNQYGIAHVILTNCRQIRRVKCDEVCSLDSLFGLLLFMMLSQD